MKRTICTTIACLLCMAALFAQQTFTLKLRTSSQDGICEFYVSYDNNSYNQVGYTHQIPAGKEITVNTSKRPNYYGVLGQWKLTGWRVTQGAVTLHDYNYYSSDGGGSVKLTMPEGDVSITAVMEYNPDNPDNPQSEGAWYPDEGLLVMDYMDGRDFNKTLRSVIPDESDYSLVRKVVVGGNLNYWGGFSFLDKLQYLERVDLSRLNGNTYYRIWGGDGRNKPWKELLLPASISEIRSQAFEGTNLESFTIFATTPPTIGLDNEGHQNAFPSSGGMAVYVPEEALALYANVPGWKDFNLQPIQENGADITVNIDAAGRIADYQGMTLELKNVKSLYTRAMIITGRTAYTFPTLPKQTTYNIRLLSRTGSTVAHADNVYLDQENIELTMGSLKRLCTLSLQVKEGTKDIGSDRYSCLWLNQQGNVIGRNTQQDGLAEDEPVQALITLTDPALTATYVSSDTIMVTPSTSMSTVSYQLMPIPTHRLTTVVQRADGKFMGRQTAKVSINKSGTGELVRQLSFSTLTNSGGVSSGEQAPLPEGDYEVTASVESNNLCTVTQHLHLYSDQVLTFALNEANGSTVSLKWTHYGVAADGEAAPATDMSAADGAITLRDVTNGVNLTDFAITAGGSLRLQEQLEPGTTVELTVGYRDGAQYAPAVQTAKADADGNVAFDITTRDYGTLSVSFREAACSKVSIRLYDSKGKLAVAGNANTATKDFTLLKDDIYTVVLMEGGDMAKAMNSTDDLQKFLVQDVDYVMQQVPVSSGKMTAAAFEQVPTLSPVSFYTIDETRIAPRLYQLTVGLNQTYSLCPKFKPEFNGRISDVKAVFTIPDDGSQLLVEGSVIMSNIKTDYTYKDGMLTVPVVEGQLLRFCVVPIEAGDYTPVGKLTFMLDGEPREQPLPATTYTVSGLELDVPPVVNTKEVTVSGTASAQTPVTVIINGQEVCTTISDFYGKWNVTVPLVDTYNMAQNDIYVQCVGPSGYKVKSPTSTVIYDLYSIQGKSVRMSYYNPEFRRNEIITFDLEKGTWSPDSYYFYYPNGGKGEFTFDVTLTTPDSTNIDEVLLYVYMNREQQRLLFPKYNEQTGTWVATDVFSMYALPTQVRVFVEEHSPKIVGDQVVSDCVHYFDDIAEEMNAEDPELAAIIEQANNSAEGSEEEQEAMRQLMIHCGVDPDVVMNTERLPDTPEAKAQWEAEMDAALAAFDAADAEFNKLAAEGYFTFDPTPLNELGQILGGYTFSKLSSSTRQYYEARARGEHPAMAAAGPNEEEYVLDLESGGKAYYRVHDNGYTIVIPQEDLQITCDYSAMDSEVAAAVRELHHDMATLSRLVQQAPYRAGSPSFEGQVKAIIERIAGLIDTINGYVSEIEGAVQLYVSGAKKAIDANVDKIHDATMKAWDKFHACSERWGYGLRLKNMKLKASNACNQLEKLRLGKMKLDKISATWSKIGKVGKFLSILSLISDYRDFISSYETLMNLYYSVPDPCKLEQAKADGLRSSIDRWGTARLVQKGVAIVNDAASVASALAGILATITTAGTGVVFGGIGVGASFAISTANWLGNMASDYIWDKKIAQFRKEIDALKCDTVPCDKRPLKFDDDKELAQANGSASDGGSAGGMAGGCDGNKDCHKGRSTKKSGEPGGCPGPPGPPGGPTPLLDPSGYIYEAVASNRVADATASVYYKELYEDMYGDSHEREVLWDAAKFGQVNPQLTDEEGKYGWDVPSGWWQVRVVKDGYVPTTSEWLPVPPPQLDVNLELQQPTPPIVSRVVATEQGVELRFDKYMKPQQLTKETIFLTKNGQQVDGTIRLLNQEWTPDSARSFTSRLLFSPATPLKLKERVRLTVKAGVESYANVGMLQDFTQEFDVEERVSELVADSVVGILHGEDYTLTVSAQPEAVAKGKKVTVKSLNPDIASIAATELTLDQNGKATLTVQGKGYGTTALRLTLADDADVQTLTVVDVNDADNLVTRKPTASLINGVEVAYGTTVRLQSETPGAVIYYTLDGSCPCDNPNRLRYNSPIVITRDMTLKAIAVAPGYAESDVASFNYRVKRDPQSITTAEATRINRSFYTLQGIMMKEGSQLKRGVYLLGKKKIVVK